MNIVRVVINTIKFILNNFKQLFKNIKTIIMWFIKGRPNGVNIVSYFESKPKGYQENTFLFNITALPEKTVDGRVWIGFPFPSAPNKERFGLTVKNETCLYQFEPQMEDYSATVITNDDIELWDNFRKFKKDPTIDLANVQDLIYWHVDDFAIATMWVEPDKWYQITFTHKIASDSQLFVPTRFPVFVANGKDEVLINYTMWVVNTLCYINNPSYLNKIETRTRSIQKFKVAQDFKYDVDTRFDTDNWESSDDENSD